MKRAPMRLRRPRSAGVTRAKFYMTYPKKLVKEPLIYQMTQKFDLVFNVRSASVSDEIGIIALELDGSPEEIEGAVSWFRAQGVTVEPIEKNVIE
jgi:ABC-type methionine transport system ATPase subunit